MEFPKNLVRSRHAFTTSDRHSELDVRDRVLELGSDWKYSTKEREKSSGKNSFWIYARHFIIGTNPPGFSFLHSKQHGIYPKTRCHIDPDTAGVPVDYSFRRVENLGQLQHGLPREYRVGMPKIGRSKKYVSRSLWANYNNLVDLSSVASLVNVSLERPENISWLDVSFNQIQTISSELLSLKNLMILYLHGNKIQFLIEVAKLKELRKLKTLTLHGNPIEEIPNYRLHIIKLLPNLKNLDFSMVADCERTVIKYRAIT